MQYGDVRRDAVWGGLMAVSSEPQDTPGRRSDRFSTTMRQPIIFDGRSTPVKTALFIILCAAWILPGLIGHDPWKTESTTFGIIFSMLQEGNWLLPAVAGIPNSDYPPLYYWVAAAMARIFSPILPLHDGARLATALFIAITLVYTNKTAKRLFDERTGRISVVLLIGSLGIFVRGHEMNPEVAGLAGMAVALYGLTRIRSETTKGGITTGVGTGIMAMSIGIVPALVIPAVAVALVWMLGEWKNRLFQRGIGVALLAALPFMLVYPASLLVLGTISPLMWTDAIMGTVTGRQHPSVDQPALLHPYPAMVRVACVAIGRLVVVEGPPENAGAVRTGATLRQFLCAAPVVVISSRGQ